jgi:hypothetical protein
MPGIKNRGTKVHKVDTRYNRKKKKSLDDELIFEEQENFAPSGGVVDYSHAYSLPPLILKRLGDM